MEMLDRAMNLARNHPHGDELDDTDGENDNAIDAKLRFRMVLWQST